MNLKINHRLGIANVKFFNSFKVNLKYDSMGSTFSFNVYFDPNNKEHAELMCVSHFHEAIVEHEGETLITGYILSQVFNHEPEKTLVQIGGYSKPGVLEDCEIPTDLYPLQTDGLSLKEITERIIAKFRLKLKIDDIVFAVSIGGITTKQKAEKKIKTSTAAESQNVKSYLSELAVQQNIIISHNEFGDLLFTQPQTNLKPLFHIEKNMPGYRMSMAFNGQQIHSHITVIKQADSDGGNAGEYTIRNPYCPVAAVYRPRVVTQSSGDDVSVQEYAMNLLKEELKNIILTVEVDRWKIDGKIIRPNNIITCTDRELFLYEKTEWFITEFEMSKDEKKESGVLICVPKDVFTNETPKNIFVNPHENFPRALK